MSIFRSKRLVRSYREGCRHFNRNIWHFRYLADISTDNPSLNSISWPYSSSVALWNHNSAVITRYGMNSSRNTFWHNMRWQRLMIESSISFITAILQFIHKGSQRGLLKHTHTHTRARVAIKEKAFPLYIKNIGLCVSTEGTFWVVWFRLPQDEVLWTW
jgi:hypothetical protein